ncbi:unnamed protein product [Urochloa humidicola]
MAGDAWVADIVWHTLILYTRTAARFVSSWFMEIMVGLSFLMQLVLSLLAGFRWHGRCVGVRRVIKFCYVTGDLVAKYALGSLSVNGISSERQLVAFWVPFFLIHLGGPDNITAYQLEDN